VFTRSIIFITVLCEVFSVSKECCNTVVHTQFQRLAVVIGHPLFLLVCHVHNLQSVIPKNQVARIYPKTIQPITSGI
jgi:hypothetical protein